MIMTFRAGVKRENTCLLS